MTNIIELAKKAGLELNWFDDNFPVLHGKLITLEQLIRADERELNLRTAEDFDAGAEAAAAIRARGQA